jgi:nitrate reductase NapE component
MAKVNPAWLIKKHPGDLKAQIRDAVAFGFHPVSQDATTAHLLRKKKFSCLIATLSFLCFGVGFLIYLFYYMAKRDDEIYLDTNIQPKGKDLEAYVAQEEKKKQRNTMILVGFLIFIFVILPILSFIGAAFGDIEDGATSTTSTPEIIGERVTE